MERLVRSELVALCEEICSRNVAAEVLLVCITESVIMLIDISLECIVVFARENRNCSFLIIRIQIGIGCGCCVRSVVCTVCIRTFIVYIEECLSTDSVKSRR